MSGDDARAWGWVDHLRAGGTTPWAAWQGTAAARGGPLPGAQQLELLRRANEAADGGLPAGLADRVLTTSAAGRGRPDLRLAGAGVGAYGHRPVDPADLGAHELVRVAAVLLAEDLVALGPQSAALPRARPWRRRHRLIGDPLVAAATRPALAAQGRPEGGPRPFVVVSAGPLDQMLADTWTRRCFEHGTRTWPQWLRFWRERDQLPPRLDLAEAVRHWHPRRSRVRIVTDPSRLAGELGVRALPEVRVPGADEAELGRRIAAVVGLLRPAEERPALMATLAGRLPVTGVPPVVVPARDRDWLEAQAARVAREVRRAGYPVVGDLAELAPRFDTAGAAGGDALDRAVLDLAVGMLVDPTWQTGRGTQIGSAEGQGTR